MNCEQAKELIDVRVQELSARGSTPLPVRERGRGEGEDADSPYLAPSPTPGATGGSSASASPLPLGEGSGVSASGTVPSAPDWADLDEHLAACPRCRAELEELARVKGLLADLATDRPNDAEIQKMLMGIQTAAVGPSRLALVQGKGWWSRNKGLVSSLTGVAAVLALAFYLGEMRYNGPTMARRNASNIKGIGTSLNVYEADDPSGWGIPVHPQQYADADYVQSYRWQEATRGDVSQYLSPSSGQGEVHAARARAAPFGGGGGGGGSAQGVFQGSSADDARVAMAKTGSPPPPPAAPVLADNVSAPVFSTTTYGLELVSPSGAQEKDKENAAAAQHSPNQQVNSAIPQNLKIIKTGELTLEVAAHADTADQVEDIVRQHGGFIADATTQEESGGALVGRIVIRVPPDRFEQVFAALKPLGRVQSENVKAADVTAEYVDTDARIKSLQITEERLRELIANKSIVDKISALLEVERELNRVRTEIEKLQGQLRVMDDRISLSTIILTLREPGRTVPSASLSVEVTTLDEAAGRLAEVLAQAGGRLVSGHTSKRGDGTLMGNYQLETTLARFADVVAAIERLGRVQERQVSNQQFKTADESWAERVKCTIALVLFERSRQLPSGSIALEVDGVEKVIEQIREIAQTHEATISSNQTHGSAEAATGATLQLRVPAGEFAKLLDALAALGRATNRSSFGEAGTIVGGAAAMPCDLTVSLTERPREVPRGGMAVEVGSFDPARQALSQAIRDQNVQVLHSSSNQRPDGTWQGTFRLGVPAKGMEAFVTTLESLGRVTGRQISGLGLGDLSRVNPDALGTIELTLAEKTSLAPGPDQATGSIRARVRDGLTGFYQSIGLIAYGLVVLLPWLLLAGLVGWLIVITRRRAAAKASRNQAVQPA